MNRLCREHNTIYEGFTDSFNALPYSVYHCVISIRHPSSDNVHTYVHGCTVNVRVRVCVHVRVHVYEYVYRESRVSSHFRDMRFLNNQFLGIIPLSKEGFNPHVKYMTLTEVGEVLWNGGRNRAHVCESRKVFELWRDFLSSKR